MQEISLLQVNNQKIMVTLNGQDCTIQLYQRGHRMFLDFAIDGEIVRQGALCIPCVNIVGNCKPFDGAIYCIDDNTKNDSRQEPPEYHGLGDRWRFFYLTPEEYAEVLEGVAEELSNAQ